MLAVATEANSKASNSADGRTAARARVASSDSYTERSHSKFDENGKTKSFENSWQGSKNKDPTCRNTFLSQRMIQTPATSSSSSSSSSSLFFSLDEMTTLNLTTLRLRNRLDPIDDHGLDTGRKRKRRNKLKQKK